MHKVGIICEYNPFHLGHQYQIEETRRSLGPDTAILCVMSGDYVQRGEAALFDKFTRAEAACRSGADLVAELPLPWCLSSAEGFAGAAVSILDALGCDTLSFGSESGESEVLAEIAEYVSGTACRERIRALMDGNASLSFARARQLAAEETLGDKAELLSEPNDILAVEYLKAIHSLSSHMNTLAVRRSGARHDSADTGRLCSAMQLRRMAEAGEDLSEYTPPAALEVFRREAGRGRLRNLKLLEVALLSRLYQRGPEDFDVLPDAGGGAGRRLYKAIQQGCCLDEIVRKASTKRYTAARMRRMLLCASMGICADDTKGRPPYIRILAANERGRACLSALRGECPLPVINRAGEIRRLDARAQRVFTLGADAHALYQLQFVTIDDRKIQKDWKTSAALV